MGRITTKEQRYISRVKCAEMIDCTKDIRERHITFYNIIVENKEQSFEEIIEKLNDKLKLKFDKEMIAKYIKRTKFEISATKGDELIVIYNYINARENNDYNKALLYKAKLNLIDRKKEEVAKKSKDAIKNRTNKENLEIHDCNVKEVNKMMDDIINGEEVSKDLVISKMQFLKKYLKEFNKDKYMDFLFKYNNLETISKEEVKQLIEVVDFFIDNLTNNLLNLKKVDSDNKEEVEKAVKLPVTGEEALDDVIKNSNGRLLSWKIGKIERELAFYNRYKEMLIKFDKTEDLSAVKKILPNDKKQMLEQYDFIKDFYFNTKTANDVYNLNIRGIVTIPQNDYDELNNNYKKRLIK
ncbi:MAG: hypothetical protein J6O56_02535 [Bacilli bacterium]|nr:hypothetical protein [Bacilli bacterium]